MVTVVRVPDVAALQTQAALKFIDAVATIQAPGGGVHGDGIARVVLTGGGAGIGMLRELARLDAAATAQGSDYPALRIDWSRVHVFFGDERNVPVTDAESNEGQARAALLDHVNIPAAHIHGMGLGGVDLTEAAADYAAILTTHAPQGFDLHLLGMGGEGHVNSIFPHSAAAVEEEHLVVAVTDSPKPPAERVTLTFPAINSAAAVWLLVAGAEKAEAASHVMANSPTLEWPATKVQGRNQTVLFLADDAATPN